MTENLLVAPSLSGIMLESPDYRVLGVGLTDRVFLVGHADGLELNTPFRVIDMREAVNKLAANQDSPLLRAMLQVYDAGCRDIWLMAAAPMSEWVPDTEDRTAFYPQWLSRLNDAYEVLLTYDQPQVLVPLHAPLNVSEDFLSPLVTHCAQAFLITGAPRIGMIGTTGTLSTDTLTELQSLDLNYGAAGKFVMTVIGEGVFTPQTSTVAFKDPLVAVAAGYMSNLKIDQSLIYKRLPGVVGVVGQALKPSQIHSAANSKLNIAVRTQLGKRGRPFEVVLASDNTLAENGSDFWAIPQIRLIGRVIDRFRQLGSRYLGTISFGEFKRDCQQYLLEMYTNNLIRQFDLNIVRDPEDTFGVLVSVTLYPYTNIREIRFVTRVGPGV